MIKLIAAGTALVGASVGIVVASETSSAALAATCHSRVLRPVFAGTDGTAGTLHDHWELVNVGTATCSVSGFPTVHNYRADGRPLPTSTTHSGSPTTVTLHPGEHASFFLSYPEPGNVGCTPQPAARMTIQPGTTELPLITNRGEKSCHGHLDETPLVHGG
jgi:hypothetical protein